MTEVKHSPLGASGAERWMNCPGSVTLIKNLSLPESDEPDYRAEGTAAHEFLARILVSGQDAWEMIGQVAENGVECTEEIANAIQVFADTVRPDFAHASRPRILIEFPVSSPVHPAFYGTLDNGVVNEAEHHVFINDYKHGVGVTVEVDDNPQLKYYAFGLLENVHPVDDDWKVTLRIIQPRGFHTEGPVREWSTTAGAIRAWVHEVLVPAMWATELDNDLLAGPWCRFCPAKLVCPMLTGLFRAAATIDPATVVELSNDSLGSDRTLWAAVKLYGAALEAETLRRLQLGYPVKGNKLVAKKADRVWKPQAQVLFVSRFGRAAQTEPELKSPAQMEKISPEAKVLVKEWAFTPQTGLTVALDSDPRQAVKVQTMREAFPSTAEIAGDAET